jgi:hypothetical protein
MYVTFAKSAGNDGTISGFQVRALNAAGAGAEQQDVHTIFSQYPGFEMRVGLIRQHPPGPSAGRTKAA